MVFNFLVLIFLTNQTGRLILLGNTSLSQIYCQCKYQPIIIGYLKIHSCCLPVFQLNMCKEMVEKSKENNLKPWPDVVWGVFWCYWFMSTSLCREKSHWNVKSKLFWVITFTLWWNICIFMGVVSRIKTPSSSVFIWAQKNPRSINCATEKIEGKKVHTWFKCGS